MSQLARPIPAPFAATERRAPEAVTPTCPGLKAGKSPLSVRPLPAPVLSAGGQPLPAALRQEFEPFFGHNLSRVRVHADAPAPQVATHLAADAGLIPRARQVLPALDDRGQHPQHRPQRHLPGCRRRPAGNHETSAVGRPRRSLEAGPAAGRRRNAVMGTKRVVIHIDHLILNGFSREERHAIAVGLEQELGRVRGMGDVGRLRVDGVQFEPGSKRQRDGENVAQGIGKEIKQ